MSVKCVLKIICHWVWIAENFRQLLSWFTLYTWFDAVYTSI